MNSPKHPISANTSTLLTALGLRMADDLPEFREVALLWIGRCAHQVVGYDGFRVTSRLTRTNLTSRAGSSANAERYLRRTDRFDGSNLQEILWFVYRYTC